MAGTPALSHTSVSWLYSSVIRRLSPKEKSPSQAAKSIRRFFWTSAKVRLLLVPRRTSFSASFWKNSGTPTV